MQKKKFYRAPKLYHAQSMSHLAEIYRMFPQDITRECVITNVYPWVFLLDELAIYTGASCCTVKFPDEVCVGHTKRVEEIKELYNHSLQSAVH